MRPAAAALRHDDVEGDHPAEATMPHAALRLWSGDHDRPSCRTVRHPSDHAAVLEPGAKPSTGSA